ncbi:MAG TPA: tryptophan 2,3-dioxygenase [Flavobacteriales bacterium]|nr:tryptophan 2,3-dioxygenase [Flavobacteriales bacterium]
MDLNPEISERLKRLEAKYESMGQDMVSYLDGLLYTDSTNYWNYINVDTLLTLQKPSTDFPDEMVFIMYHQITELYFKMILHEQIQIAHNGREILPSGEDKGWKKSLDKDYFIQCLSRINRYFESLTQSFDIMVDGMEKEQFLRFRMALLPASGFQSVQYRKIEICATNFIRLVDKSKREKFEKEDNPSIEEMYEEIYWKLGAMELSSGKKTLTLRQFEKKYSDELMKLGEEYIGKNVWAKYKGLSAGDQSDEKLQAQLKWFDVNVNVNWPLVHYKSAVRYLQLESKDIMATGGTNWQKYLPPKFQKRIFFPDLWSDDEIEQWGKAWVKNVTNS